jgi:hypothetical protein
MTEFVKKTLKAIDDNKLPRRIPDLMTQVFENAPFHGTTAFNSTYQSLKTAKMDQSIGILRKETINLSCST